MALFCIRKGSIPEIPYISFASFWSRRTIEEDDSSPWIIGGVQNIKILPPTSHQQFNHIKVLQDNPGICAEPNDFYHDYLETNNRRNEPMAKREEKNFKDLRQVVKNKAEKHKHYFKSLIGTSVRYELTSSTTTQMAEPVPSPTVEPAFETSRSLDDPSQKNKSTMSFTTTLSPSGSPQGSTGKRQRRQGVYERTDKLEGETEVTLFKSVKQLRNEYLAMLEKTAKDLNHPLTPVPISSAEKPFDVDDRLLVPPQSDYCSSSASGASDDEREKNYWHRKHKVRRCGSSDSAMGYSDDEQPSLYEEKKDCDPGTTYKYPVVHSPYSPRSSIDHSNVPSKTLIEAQYVLYPVDRKCSMDCVSEDTDFDISESRRQSCFTDDGDETPRYRCWRTPSVVVSDYSDDIMGLTLEDIEYISSHRKETSSSPDSSLHSSCSNLNYCGSTISRLDSEYVLTKPYRKSSNCSTCSTLSGDEEPESTFDTTLRPKKSREVSDSVMR